MTFEVSKSIEMFDLERVPREHQPSWAMIRPERPILGEIRRGVLYTGIELPTIRAFLDSPQAISPAVIRVWAAVGLRLFWGREDGAWIPYDVEAKDQNEGRLVRERAWPWCWGDQIWVYATWLNQPVFLHLAVDWCELLVQSPAPASSGRAPTSNPDPWMTSVAAVAHRVTGGYAREISEPHRFLRGPV